MLIYAVNHTPRLQYVLDELIVNRLGLSYKITDNQEYFKKSPSFKINYHVQIREACLNIPASYLLSEDTIHEVSPRAEPDKKWKYIFFKEDFIDIPDVKTDTQILNFDLFSCVFYLLSRYEEYLPSHKDEHARYVETNSLAFRAGFLEFPLVDYWVQNLKICLKKLYPEIVFKPISFTQINSIDIDFAYKYKGLSMLGQARKAIGSILRNNFDAQVFDPPEKDPYDTYDYLTRIATEKNVPTIFFFLLANSGKYDKNLSPNSPILQKKFNELSLQFESGLHPSYASNSNIRQLGKEFLLFEKITGKKSRISRNHFLKIKLPSSYEHLIEQGVEYDYSLAYTTSLGFRASTSMAFYFFDLLSNKSTKLRVQPPCLMDVTLRLAMQLKPEEAIKKIQELKASVMEVEGTFISIWHNSSFDEKEGWAGWDQVYEAMFE